MPTNPNLRSGSSPPVVPFPKVATCTPIASQELLSPFERPDAKNCSHHISSFIGTTDEVMDAMPSLPLSEIKALPNEQLVPLGIVALRDSAANIAVLAELRQRFRSKKSGTIMGYNSWKDFVRANCGDMSIRTIQKRLAALVGRDASKVNKTPGNMHTRPHLNSKAAQLAPALVDTGTVKQEKQSATGIIEGTLLTVLPADAAVDPATATRTKTIGPNSYMSPASAFKSFLILIGQSEAKRVYDKAIKTMAPAQRKHLKCAWTCIESQGLWK